MQSDMTDQVVVVTGAGNGLGRAHALAFAEAGAAVVVNDVGAGRDGTGGSMRPAQQVADAITAAGGRAVANTDDISTWDGAKSLTSDVIPVADYLTLGDCPHLSGFRCVDCDAVYLLRRSACSRCGRDALGDRQDLGDSGVVTAATAVHCAPAGVTTPFVSSVVALDGGGYVRTNLTGPIDDPVAAIGRRALMRTRPLATDIRGAEAIGYEFEVQDKP